MNDHFHWTQIVTKEQLDGNISEFRKFSLSTQLLIEISFSSPGYVRFHLISPLIQQSAEKWGLYYLCLPCRVAKLPYLVKNWEETFILSRNRIRCPFLTSFHLPCGFICTLVMVVLQQVLPVATRCVRSSWCGTPQGKSGEKQCSSSSAQRRSCSWKEHPQSCPEHVPASWEPAGAGEEAEAALRNQLGSGRALGAVLGLLHLPCLRLPLPPVSQCCCHKPAKTCTNHVLGKPF